AELRGCPLRIVAGRGGAAEGGGEAGERAGGDEHKLPVDDAAGRATALLAELDAAAAGADA
ncbi:MAG: hypothetical protein WD810_09120, partial [Solirubrobacterales bacterium]